MGEEATVTCKAVIDPSAHLLLCYGQPGETLHSLNHSKSCFDCYDPGDGECIAPNGTDWIVHRFSRTDDQICKTYLGMVLTIPGVREGDEGKVIYCIMHDGTYSNLFMTKTMRGSDQQTHIKSYYYWTGGGFLLIILTGVTVVVVVVYWKQRRQRRDGQTPEVNGGLQRTGTGWQQ